MNQMQNQSLVKVGYKAMKFLKMIVHFVSVYIFSNRKVTERVGTVHKGDMQEMDALRLFEPSE